MWGVLTDPRTSTKPLIRRLLVALSGGLVDQEIAFWFKDGKLTRYIGEHNSQAHDSFLVREPLPVDQYMKVSMEPVQFYDPIPVTQYFARWYVLSFDEIVLRCRLYMPEGREPTRAEKTELNRAMHRIVEQGYLYKQFYKRTCS